MEEGTAPLRSEGLGGGAGGGRAEVGRWFGRKVLDSER